MKGDVLNMKEENGVERLASHRIQGVLPKKYHMQYRSGRELLVEEQSLKKVEEMILAASEKLSTPESLQPENMSRKLEQIRKKKQQQRIYLAVMLICVIIIATMVLLFCK